MRTNNQPNKQPNKQLPDYSASPDFFVRPIGLFEIWRSAKTSESDIQEVFSGTQDSGVTQQGLTYAQKLFSGIQPLGRKRRTSQPVTQQMMKTAIENAYRPKETVKEKPKSKHIFRGSAQLDSSESASLAADVDLVASGVAKDATEKQLEDFLIARGIKPVKVECLTKAELIVDQKVRSKTMKVTVRASQHKEAMNPDVWPFRVGVRHFRAPQRARQGAPRGRRRLLGQPVGTDRRPPGGWRRSGWPRQQPASAAQRIQESSQQAAGDQSASPGHAEQVHRTR